MVFDLQLEPASVSDSLHRRGWKRQHDRIWNLVYLTPNSAQNRCTRSRRVILAFFEWLQCGEHGTSARACRIIQSGETADFDGVLDARNFSNNTGDLFEHLLGSLQGRTIW